MHLGIDGPGAPGSSDSGSSDGETDEPLCPLCCNEMDVYDRHFFPCSCGYQICGFCYNQLKEVAAKEDTNAKCPACRTEYDEKAFSYEQPSAEEIERAERKKREKRRMQQQQPLQQQQQLQHQAASQAQNGTQNGSAAHAATMGSRTAAANGQQNPQQHRASKESTLPQHHQAAGPRAVQRDSVYVTGLPQNVCREEILRRADFFGRYGRIQRLSVNRNGSAQVTFTRQDEAERCIHALDGHTLDNRTIRACHGTNRYCPAYIRGQQCREPDCAYMHENAETDASKQRNRAPGMQQQVQQQPQSQPYSQHQQQHYSAGALSGGSVWGSQSSSPESGTYDAHNGGAAAGFAPKQLNAQGARGAAVKQQLHTSPLQHSNGGMVPPPPPPPPHFQQQYHQQSSQHKHRQQAATLSSLHDVLARQQQSERSSEQQKQNHQQLGPMADDENADQQQSKQNRAGGVEAMKEQQQQQQPSSSPPFPVEILNDSVDPWAFVAERGGCGLPGIGESTQSRFSFARMGSGEASTSADSLFRSLMGADASASAAAAASSSNAPPPGFSSVIA